MKLACALASASAVVCGVFVACGPLESPVLSATNATIAYHVDRGRLGGYPSETGLTPAVVAGFTQVWESPIFDTVTLGGVTFAPHVYAAPLYLDDLPVTGGLFTGIHAMAVFVATSNGFVYAIAAAPADANAIHVDAGTILWRVGLGHPVIIPGLDAKAPAGVPVGVLGTPFIDVATNRMYVASNDGAAGWQIYALDVASGTIAPGWPVNVDDASVFALDRGAHTHMPSSTVLAQNGALNLSAAGDLLYVPFGPYAGIGPGWMVVIDTKAAKVHSTFSSGPNGAFASTGGPALDGANLLFAATGNSAAATHDAPATWGDSLLSWNGNLDLVASYTPYDYCALDDGAIDFGESSPVILPAITSSPTTTPNLIVLAGDHGSVYLVDHDHLPGKLDHRPACSVAAAADPSLLPPSKAPLSVFGPDASITTTPAYVASDVGQFLYVAAASSKPPSLARLKIAANSGAPAYLTVEAMDTGLQFVSPGSPVVSSHDDGTDPIVWIVDSDAPAGTSLLDPNASHPVLYAIDGTTLQVIWKTGSGDLHVGGSHVSVTIARATAFVGTDRLQAFNIVAP